MGDSSIKKPMRFPSRPRTERRETLPTPPCERRVTPIVLLKMSLTSLTEPAS